MNWLYPKPFIERITVTQGVIDELNHTNNAAYVNWFENIAWQHSKALGLSIDHYKEQNRAMAIVKAEYQYLQATKLDEALMIATWLVSCDGKLSCQREFEIKRLSDQKTVTTGKWQLICIDMQTGKPKRMPTNFAEIYGAALISTST